MAGDDEIGMLQALGRLIDGAHLAVPDQLPHLIDETFMPLGWRLRVYLADYEQRTLRSLDVVGEHVPGLSIDGSLAGRCYRQNVPVGARQPEPHVWIPLVDGVDRLGVIRLELPRDVTFDDPTVASHVRWASYLIGHLIATKSVYTDYFQMARLTRQRSTSSELIWSLLPPLTVAAEGIAVAGRLEPHHSIAGDVFDYAIDGDTAHLAIADATGHDLNASLIGALVLAAYRSGRRRLVGLPATVSHIDDVLEGFAHDTYASGVFGELDMRAGILRYAVAGHPPPLLMRAGKIVKSLDGGRRILLGFPGHDVPVATEPLEPGDWIVFYTDGVVEARDRHKQLFGVDRLVALLQRCAAHRQNAPESLRRIMQEVLVHQEGVLQDDATIVLVQWMTSLEHRLAAT